jgi:D-glycero-D-manno-heptose 1,7-bisphosphate phosphatase
MFNFREKLNSYKCNNFYRSQKMSKSLIDYASINPGANTFNPVLETNRCVIGLDRDGVINQDLGTYCFRPADFDPIGGSLEAVAFLRNKGYKIVIITDQGGIEKGIYTTDDVDTTHNHMLQLLGQAGCPSIDAIYYSTSSRKEDYYAKPNIGMFTRCETEHPTIKFKGGYYVGDKIKDLKAAIKIGARPILVRTGYGAETEKELKKYTYREIKRKTLIYNNLAEFASTLA